MDDLEGFGGGDKSMCRSQISDWHRRFKYGREFVESDERDGRPVSTKTPADVDRVWVNADQCYISPY